MGVKSDLKKIVGECLANIASSIFINKSLAIIDESAESRESLLAAADRISKRIALFIDTDLSRKVFDILIQEIEKRELISGIRRQHIRVAVCKKVHVTCSGIVSELETANISAGGMYIKSAKPLPVGSKVALSLSLNEDSRMHLKGVVVNAKCDIGKHPAGMGIEFREVRDDDQNRLREFVRRASAQDIRWSREETETKPSPGLKDEHNKPRGTL
jgi:uncharacterized protein (TIGR02266 family)